jgi:hypothetical protein
MRTFSTPQRHFTEEAIETVTELSRDQAHGNLYHKARIGHGQ